MTTPKPKASWFDVITPDLLSRLGAATPSHVEDYGRDGFSVCTERHPGEEPPDAAITIISRVR